MNSLKTVILLGVLSGLLLFGGEIAGGRNGLMIGRSLAVAMNFFSYFFSDKLSLMTYSAEPVTPQDNPEVYARVHLGIVLRSEEHTSELQSRFGISYAVFCLK